MRTLSEKQITVKGPQEVLDALEAIELIPKAVTPPPPPPPPVGELPVPEPDQLGNITLRKSNTIYYLDRDVTNPVYILGHSITLNTNGFSIAVSGAPAVRIYVAWLHKEIYGALKPADDFRLEGSGKVTSLTHDAFEGLGGARIVVDRVRLRCVETDTACVRTSSSVTVNNCTCISDVTKTKNRHQLPAVIVSHWGSVTVTNSIIIGGQVGINARSGSIVKGNFISQNSIATNGYAVVVYRGHRVQIEDNLIVPRNGRGVLINAGIDDASEDKGNIVRGNTIFAIERPNAEYGGRLNACCVRVRYGARNNVVSGNNCLAVGGQENLDGGWKFVGASALYLSVSPGQENLYAENYFSSVVDGKTKIGDVYAKAITLESQGSWKNEVPHYCHDVIRDNTIASNHIGLSCSGPDGYQQGAHMDLPIADNEFVAADGDVDLFFAQASAKAEELGMPQEVFERLEEVRNEMSLTDINLNENWAHVWTTAIWRTPVNVTIKGSGPLKVVRRAHPDYPVNITVDPS